MRRMMIAAAACALAAGLVAAQDPAPKPAQPAVQPKAVQPAVQPLLPKAGMVTALKMAQLEEDFELVEAQREVKRAHVTVAEVGVRVAEVHLDRLGRLAASSAVAKEEVEKAKLDVVLAKAQVDIRVAELKEVEVKVKHAKKRLDDAKLGGVRPPPVVRPLPLDPKAVDPLPPVRFAADEKEVFELKEKIAKVKGAIQKSAVEERKAEAEVKVAEAELAKVKAQAIREFVPPSTTELSRLRCDLAKDVLGQMIKGRKALEEQAAVLEKKLKDIEK